eukprot:4144669-Pleurochrysis_carterae.AAC.8
MRASYTARRSDRGADAAASAAVASASAAWEGKLRTPSVSSTHSEIILRAPDVVSTTSRFCCRMKTRLRHAASTAEARGEHACAGRGSIADARPRRHAQARSGLKCNPPRPRAGPVFGT